MNVKLKFAYKSILTRTPQKTKLSMQVNFHNHFAFGDFDKFYRVSPLAT